MEQIHAFERDNTISFSSRNELIQFVSKYFANHYKEHCEFWKATAMDDRAEMAMWDARSEREAPRLEKALKYILEQKRYFRKKLKLTSKSVLFKEAFKKAQMSCQPQNCIPCNVEYEIKGLVFCRDVKDRPIR